MPNEEILMQNIKAKHQQHQVCGNNTTTQSDNFGANQWGDNHSKKTHRHHKNRQQQQRQTSSIVEYTEVFVWGEDKFGQLGIDS